MEKKEYTAPELTLIGDIKDITKGQGLRGHADQAWIFSWGRPRRRTDPTSGN